MEISHKQGFKINYRFDFCLTIFTLLAFLTIPGVTVAQQEVGHFAPGVLNIRDFAMPQPGFYGVVYNYFYSTTRLNDANGNKIESVHIQPGTGPGVDVDVDVDLNVYALAPTFIWVSKWKILGAKYGAYISPSFNNTSLGASLAVTTGSGRSAHGSTFGVSDLFVQPIWLDWSKSHWDIAIGYGFCAPVGRYNTETVTLPVIGDHTTEASDNIGLGFWTNQFQGAASYYPWTDQRMAISTALTYEIHGNKKDFDVEPGQNLTLNWGISQYLPLKKDQTLLLEIGPAGYNSWQTGDDKGQDAKLPPTKDNAGAVGGQVGLTQVKWNASLNFHYFYEYESKDRFQGQSMGLNFAIKF